MSPATPNQLKAIHALLHRQGLINRKTEIIEGVTNGRSSSSKDLSFQEAFDLLQHLNQATAQENKTSRLMSKLFAMCHEMGWITETTVVQNGQLKKKKDYSRVHGWVLKYGYLKKELRKYTYKELPKLVSQLELHVYNLYIEKKSK